MASGIKYTSEVLNQRGAPALFEDILTNRPAAGFVGRLFFATDVTSGNTIFRDNGTTWDALAGNGGGGGGGVTTLSNGLTLTGSNGTLGGTLANDTTIGGSTLFSLSFNNLTFFNALANQTSIGKNATLFSIDTVNKQYGFNDGTVLINTNVKVDSSLLTIDSNNKGVLLPRMSTTLRNAITSPATGLLVYDTTLLLLYQYDGTAWAAVGGASTNIYNTNGSLTSARTLTLNSQPLTVAGTTSSRFFANGNVGIGTTTDAGLKLDVNGTARFTVGFGSIFLTNQSGYSTAIQSSGHLAITAANSFEIYNTGVGQNMFLGTAGTLYLGYSATGNVIGSVGIGYNGTAISTSAILDIKSTTKGALLPRMTTAQINAIATPAEGLIIYNTTLSNLCAYQAGVWVKFSHSPM